MILDLGLQSLLFHQCSDIHSELHVTAVRELYGVLVECTGGRGLMSSNFHRRSVCGIVPYLLLS